MKERFSDFGNEPFVFRLNESGGPSLLVQVCAERGWRLYQPGPGNDDKWNLWWKSGSFSQGNHKGLTKYQFLNHIPKGGNICRKDNLSRLLRCMKKIYGSIFDFSPPGYHIPIEYAKLVSEYSRLKRITDDAGNEQTVWIHKPVAQSQGRGIFLFRNLSEVQCGSLAIIQRYIERPLLIAGYKFDLRLYVCVPSLSPLTVYMYTEGLARFSTDKYTLSDLHNPYRHLTNSSLNKTGPKYSECKDRIGNGCKWTLKQLRRQLSGRLGHRGGCASEWLAWQKIRCYIVLTLLAHSLGTTSTRNCFELYGFDVLLDDELNPWILEVNLSPALAVDCDADVAVKSPMLHELFDLIGLPMRHTGLSIFAPCVNTNLYTNSYDCLSEEESTDSRKTRLVEPIIKRSKYKTMALNVNIATQDNKFRDLEIPKGITIDKTINRRERGNTEKQSEIKALKQKYPHPWGNEVKWEQSPGRVGKWVRVFPHHKHQYSEDIKTGIYSVASLLKTVKSIAKGSSGIADQVLETTLRQQFTKDPYFHIWIPPL